MNNPIHILYVDDSPLDRELVRDALEKEQSGFQITEASSRTDFDAKLSEGDYDLVLSDFNILGFDGLQVLDAVHAKNPRIPVVIVTGTGSEEVAAEAIKRGAADYVIKTTVHIQRLSLTIHAVLEKKRLKEERERTKQERDRLFNYSLDPLCVVGFDGYFKQLNPAWEKTLGWTNTELMAKPYIEFIHPDDREPTVQATTRLICGKPIISFENRYRCKDGTYRWISWNSYPLTEESLIFSVARDVTERKQAEQELHKSEERYEALLEAFPDEILFTDLKGCVQKLSPSGLELFGYDQGALSDRSVLDFLVPEDRDRAAHNIALMHQEIFTGPGEYRGIRADGSLVDIECNGNFIRGSDRKPTGMVFVIRDISKRKQMEAELKQYRENLEKLVEERTAELGRTVEELQFKNVMLSTQQEASIDGILVVDEAANIVLYNHRFVEMWDLPAKLVEDRVDEPVLKFVTAKVADPRSFAQKVQYLYGHRQETSQDEILLADGRVFDRYSAPMLGSENRYYGRVWYFRDITERKRAEEKLIETLKRLRRAFDATIQVMVSAVEVRDPYTAGHQLRSADLAGAIATEMGFSQEKIEGINVACSIHDLGKISIPAEILSKPSKLSVSEFSLIKEHPWKGYEILKNVESSWPLAEIVYQHHERMDGSGYPRNLKGDEIVIEARILAVADVVEAMASHRPYRPALGIDVALEEIEKNKGVLYDPEAVDACLKLFREKGYQLSETIL